MDRKFDMVVRGGEVVDGTGAPSFAADVAIKDGKIAAIGKVADSGTEEIDARDKIVTPGFVDIHTHYDGQALWAERLSPSSSHGVTSVVGGNCGVGFAPCRQSAESELEAMALALKDTGKGVLQAVFGSSGRTLQDEIDLLSRLTRISGRPASFTMAQDNGNPEAWRDIMAHLAEANTKGP